MLQHRRAMIAQQAAAAPGAVTYVEGSSQFGDPLTVDISGASAGDVAVVFALNGDRLTAITETADGGWTTVDDINGKVAGDTAFRSAVFYKVLGASETNPTFDGGSANVLVYMCFRGVDNSNPLDVSWVRADHWFDDLGVANCNPNHPDITTANANSAVVLFGGWNGNSITACGAPSGYTLGPEINTSTTTTRQGAGAYLLNAGAAGLKSPGVWTNTYGSELSYHLWVLSLRAA